MAPPTPPSNVTATRVSDTSTTITWTRNLGGGQYSAQALRVSIDGSDFNHVTNLNASVESYTYKSAANHKYRFQVIAFGVNNPASVSPMSNTILTTPATLASLSSSVLSPGVIRVTLPKRPTPYPEAQVVISETHNGGSTWTVKATLDVSALHVSATTTWDDTSAETTGTVQYRARVQTNGGTQSQLFSAYKQSVAAGVTTPPNAPTNLTPSGLVSADTIRLAWKHNPAANGAAQSSRKLEYSINGGSSWTSIPGLDGDATAAYYDWTGAVYTGVSPGQTLLWRVATAGPQPATYGAWSAPQSLNPVGSLIVDISVHADPHTGGPLAVWWHTSPWFGDTTQVAFQVTFTDQATGVVVYNTGVVHSTGDSMEIPSSVQVNNHTYTIRVRVLCDNGIWSFPYPGEITMDFTPPEPVAVTWSYDDDSGALVLYPTFSEGDEGTPIDDTVAWALERSLDGENWAPIGAVEGETPLSDISPRLGATSWYRSVGYSELGVAGPPTIVEIPAADVQSKWAWLNYGDDQQARVRFGWSQTVEITSGRASESYEIEGRDFPAAVYGTTLTERYNITGKLLSGEGVPPTLATATAEDMIALSRNAAVCVFRDARGAWFTARVTDMKISPARTRPDRSNEAAVSFTVERVST